MLSLQKKKFFLFTPRFLIGKLISVAELLLRMYFSNDPLGLKRNKRKCNFNYAAMSMMTSQILKFVDFIKTQKSRYSENETFFLQIKKNY